MRRIYIFFVFMFFSCGFAWGVDDLSSRLLSGTLCAMIPVLPIATMVFLKRIGRWEAVEKRFLGL